MGEAKQRRAAEQRRQAIEATRSWAMGSITVVANNVECFGWIGTKREAIELQKRYLDAVDALMPISAHSYAKRAAGYLMAYGIPKAGDVDLRPSNHGNRWDQIDIDLYKAAILWLALRESVPNTGQKLEDVFVGKTLVVMFSGDKDRILADTGRELGGHSLAGRQDAGHVNPGAPLPEDQFQMMAGVRDHNYRLDPRLAVSMKQSDLFARAGKPLLHKRDDDVIYVPRIPLDQTEADAMLCMMTICADATDPSAGVRTYAGYTEQELLRGKPGVRLR